MGPPEVIAILSGSAAAVIAIGSLIVAGFARADAKRAADAAERSAQEASAANELTRQERAEAARALEVGDARSRLAIERWANKTWALCNLRNEPLSRVTIHADPKWDLRRIPGGEKGVPIEGISLGGWRAHQFYMFGEELPASLDVSFDGLREPVPIAVQTEYPEHYVHHGNERYPNTTPWRVAKLGTNDAAGHE